MQQQLLMVPLSVLVSITASDLETAPVLQPPPPPVTNLQWEYVEVASQNIAAVQRVVSISNYSEQPLAGNMNNRNWIDTDHLQDALYEYTEDSQPSPLITRIQY